MAARLLLDESLPEGLLGALQSRYPGSVHLRQLGGGGVDDQAVWDLARAGRFILVTRDPDFVRSNRLEGAAPRVVWLNTGNAPGPGVSTFLLRARLGRG